MKKIFISILLLIAIIFGVLWYRVNFFKEKRTDILSSFSIPRDTVEVLYRNNLYWISWWKTSKPENLFLYSNLEEKFSTYHLVKKHQCSNLINGGFYTEDYQPLGLFITEGNIHKTFSYHSLIPFFFYITYDNEVGIKSEIPPKDIRLALQTGPMLIDSGIKKRLFLRSDKSARRSVVALADSGDIYFLIIYDKDSVKLGPYLAYLPSILDIAERKIGVNFKYAVNLDGGTASSFYSKYINLEETVFIGSFFCLVEN